MNQHVPAIFARDMDNLSSSLECAQFAAELGADGVVVEMLDHAADAAERIALIARRKANHARLAAETRTNN